MISLIIPVYNESEHLPELLEKLYSLSIRDRLEVIVVDDSYDDLTVNSAEPFKNKLNLQIIHRKKRLGLSSAVMEGFNRASSDILICMDGDGSHPPEKISELAGQIEAGESMVVASRNVVGGGCAEDWSLIRKLISKLCCTLVWPLTGLKDPMSGFFAISKSFFNDVRIRVKPLSYKICLELAVKGRLKKIAEIPFKFEERKAGSSKVNISVVMGMLYHFLGLFCWKIFVR